MARVEWAALGGDEVETVVAVLLYNKFPRAVRIRPSQGDYGIDVLVPAAAGTEAVDVYQIKKFATNLTASQKSQVEESFRRLMLGLVRRGVPVGDWYLVLPLDPTLDNRDWFNALPDAVIAAMVADQQLELTDDEQRRIREWREVPGRIIDWKGLVFCEALTSDYWFVTDYYLHGGQERLRNAVTDVAQLLRRDLALPAADDVDTTAVLAPADIREHLGRLQRALDGDPHFRYGLSLDPAPPQLLNEPGLLAATQDIQTDGSCITFRIYERFAEAVNMRPIPIKVDFEFAEGTPEHEAFEAWRKYGKPVTVPASMDADLPGGLGGLLTHGTVSILPPDDNSQFILRMRVRLPEGIAGPELAFTMVSMTGADQTGLWSRGADAAGVVTTEGLLDVTGKTSTISFSVAPLSGRNAAEVLPALRFVAALRHPNVLQMAPQYGPYFDLDQLGAEWDLVSPFEMRLVEALALLQERTSTPIAVPDLATLRAEDCQAILSTAWLIAGRTVVGTWSATSFPLDPAFEVDPDATYQLAVTMPLALTLGGRRLEFGAVEDLLLSVKLSRNDDGSVLASPVQRDTAYRRFLPGVPTPTPPFQIGARSAPVA
jgi:hypothetical protein